MSDIIDELLFIYASCIVYVVYINDFIFCNNYLVYKESQYFMLIFIASILCQDCCRVNQLILSNFTFN
jgi:hypothetical protein